MHINIAVVNGSPIQQKRTKDALESYNSGSPFNLLVRYFLSGKDLLNDIEESGRYEIYIMDVVLPEMDGVSIAEKLRASGDSGEIIYINGNEAHAHKAFAVHAFNYMMWPLSKKDLFRTLDDIMKIMENNVNSPIINIRLKSGIMRIRLRELIYAEAVERVVYYHLTDGSVHNSKCLRGSFVSEISELTDFNNFVVAGTSYAINLEKIKEIGRSGILLCNNETITPPKYKWIEVEKAWRTYLKN